MGKTFTKIAIALLVLISTGRANAQTCFAGFMYSIDSINQTVTFQDTSVISGHMITYAWDFGDGNTSPHQNPVHSYTHPGSYYVCLTVTADTPHCTSTICDSIVIAPQPAYCHANFNFHPSVHAFTIDFTDYSNGSSLINSWMWDFGDGSTSTQQNPSHQYADTGTYNVCLIITDAHNTCSDTFCHPVVVTHHVSNCTAAFTTVIDSMGNVNFTNTSTGTTVHTNYHWSFGDGHGSSMENPFYTYPHPGVWYVCLTITDSLCNSTFCDSVHIPHPNLHQCQAAFQFQQSNHSVNFHDFSTGAFLNYMWDFGDGQTSTMANPSHQYADTGNYTVCLVISNGSCSDTICHNLYVHQVNHCQASFTLDVDTTNGAIIFTNTSSINATDFLWTFGDGDSSTLANPTHLYAVAGHYTVCLFIHDSVSGCSAHSCFVFHTHHPPHHFALSLALFPDEITTTGIEELEEGVTFTNYPNPFSTSTTIEFTLDHASTVQLEVYSLLGKRMVMFPKHNVSAGVHQETLSSPDLTTGVYILRMTFNNNVYTRRISVIR